MVKFVESDKQPEYDPKPELIKGEGAAKQVASIARKMQGARKEDIIDALNKAGIDTLCEAIAHGVTLKDVATELGIPFVYILRWVNKDMSRKRAYEETLTAVAQTMRFDAINLVASAQDGDIMRKSAVAALMMQIAKVYDPPRRHDDTQRTVLNHKHDVDPATDKERTAKMQQLLKDAGSQEVLGSFHEQEQAKGAD